MIDFVLFFFVITTAQPDKTQNVIFYFFTMDIPAVRLEQKEQNLEDHTRVFLDLACLTHYPDRLLCVFYCTSLSKRSKARLSADGPRETLRARGVGDDEKRISVRHLALGGGHHQHHSRPRAQPATLHGAYARAHSRHGAQACVMSFVPTSADSLQSLGSPSVDSTLMHGSASGLPISSLSLARGSPGSASSH